jgi:predicted alternative tryptophan synthase beta-subunit
VVSAIAAFFIHTASVETFTGAGAYGDTYAAAVPVKGFLDDGVVLVRTGTSEQLEQKSIFYAALSDAALFAPGSRVTVNGRASWVSTTRRRDGGSLGLPSHIEVDLV